MSDERDRRAEAVEALRQALRLAGHTLYSEASNIGRDQSDDTLVRSCNAVTESLKPITQRMLDVAAAMKENQSDHK